MVATEPIAHQIKESEIQIHGTHADAELNDRKGQDDGDNDDDWGEQVNRFVNAFGDNVFFGQELHHVRYRLEQPKGTDTIGTEAVLHAGDQFTLQPRHVHHHDGGNNQEHGDDDAAHDQKDNDAG